MAPSTVTASRDRTDDRILYLTLDRPTKRNAMSVDLVRNLLEHLDDAKKGTCGAVVLNGTGSGFCAGSDLAMLARMSDNERSAFEADCGLLAREIMGHPLPVIAAVHGFAMGGGLTLAAACDIVITTSDSQWSLPEVRIGLFPAWGLEAVVSRTGKPEARRLAWGLDVISGARALENGLADILADEPLDRAREVACGLAVLPRTQAASVKSYFAPGDDVRLRDCFANALFGSASATNEAHASFNKFPSSC